MTSPSTPPGTRGPWDRLRMRLGAVVSDQFFRTASRVGQLHPQSRPERHGLERHRDIPYLETGDPAHHLDVYRPAGATGPLPVVLYVHGGGFRILSKDTHWIMALAFARRGYVVFNINYRLAPTHPFPAGITDACEAYRWVVENAARFGGDASRLVLAGESAGANLATALTVAACYRRPEPWARQVWETGIVPRAVIPACGILQVSDPERFLRRKQLPRLVFDRVAEVADAYLTGARVDHPSELELADPLLVLERAEAPHRALPPFFVPVGTADPLLDDSRRLAAALERLSTPCTARYYHREIHAFHAFVLRKTARQCWQETFQFLSETLGVDPGADWEGIGVRRRGTAAASAPGR